MQTDSGKPDLTNRGAAATARLAALLAELNTVAAEPAEIAAELQSDPPEALQRAIKAFCI